MTLIGISTDNFWRATAAAVRRPWHRSLVCGLFPTGRPCML